MNKKLKIERNLIAVYTADGKKENYKGRVITPVKALSEYIVCEVDGDRLPIMFSRKSLSASTGKEWFLTIKDSDEKLN